MVLLSGIGPIIAWRRVTVAKLRRSFTFPAVVALVVLAVLLAFGSIGPHVFALLMFGAGSFVIAAVAQEFYRGVRARQAMTSESPPVALGRLVRRNRRRYGGYIVHAGVAFALIGVAASTSFQDSRTATIRPGQSVMIHGYKVRYVRATASATAQKLSFGAVLDVTSGGHHVTTLHTSYGLYPSQDPTQGPIGRFFNGSSESQVGLRAGITQDIWAVINPNITPLQGLISKGNAVLQKALTNALAQPRGRPGSGAQPALPAARHRDREAHRAVRDAPLGRDLPADRLAAGHVAVAGRDHGRDRRSDRPLATAAAASAPARGAAPAPGGHTARTRGPGARAGLSRWAFVIVLVVLAVAVFVISAPLRGRRDHRRQEDPEAARVAELEFARDAKYREIRDAELDLRTGKLSPEDYGAIDRTLRAEAIEIMRALEASPAPHEE